MLFLRETGYQLRKKGQTMLTLAVAALLLSCMAFYLGNLRSNEEALANLSNVIEVPVKVCDSTGQSSTGLRIPCQMYDLLSEAAVYDLRCTAQAVAAMGREARAVPPGGRWRRYNSLCRQRLGTVFRLPTGKGEICRRVQRNAFFGERGESRDNGALCGAVRAFSRRQLFPAAFPS